MFDNTFLVQIPTLAQAEVDMTNWFVHGVVEMLLVFQLFHNSLNVLLAN